MASYPKPVLLDSLLQEGTHTSAARCSGKAFTLLSFCAGLAFVLLLSPLPYDAVVQSGGQLDTNLAARAIQPGHATSQAGRSMNPAGAWNSARSQRLRALAAEPTKGGAEDVAQDGFSRRAMLAGAMLASSLSLTRDAQATFGLPALPIPGAQKDAAKLAELGDKMETIINQKIESGELGISLREITRLVLHDSITLDPKEHTGGFTGSIRLPEELERPENKDLVSVVKKVEAVQKDIQAETGVQVSFADTEAFVANMVAGANFKANICAKTSPPCEDPWNAYGNKPKRMLLGRPDANEPSPAGRVPDEGSSIADFKAAFSRVKLSTKDVAILAPMLFADEAKGAEFLSQDDQLKGMLGEIERSQNTITRTNYEVSFYDALTVLVNRCLINKEMYA